jgi:hypothetical protein
MHTVHGPRRRRTNPFIPLLPRRSSSAGAVIGVLCTPDNIQNADDEVDHCGPPVSRCRRRSCRVMAARIARSLVAPRSRKGKTSDGWRCGTGLFSGPNRGARHRMVSVRQPTSWPPVQARTFAPRTPVSYDTNLKIAIRWRRAFDGTLTTGGHMPDNRADQCLKTRAEKSARTRHSSSAPSEDEAKCRAVHLDGSISLTAFQAKALRCRRARNPLLLRVTGRRQRCRSGSEIPLRGLQLRSRR